ncbi:NUDIX hydrolase [Austwickia chelonae]|uniref:NUDIX hydrolase n=1 Tax=Austwickia chelonae TaxID=100225 RepID=UPI000E286708|nr:NUDIX domain-containing protein [Austwickia chelonae]
MNRAAKNRRTVEVQTAGIVPWRRRNGRLEVALVHRRRYDDWSWPKGKLEPRENHPAAAVREAAEETGLVMRLGMPLPTNSYPLSPRGGRPHEKVIRYWAGKPVSGDGKLLHEVDKLRWATVPKASRLLTYRRDREQLDALAAADNCGDLKAWPLVLVRHGHAASRRSWNENDWLRPLSRRGRTQAQELVGLLSAYDIRHVATSSSSRCLHTVTPYAESRQYTVHSTTVLSEEGFAEDPRLSAAALKGLLRSGERALLCSHGPVIPSLLTELITRSRGSTRQMLRKVHGENMVKGEALVLHMRGRGPSAKVVAAERHLPLI